MLTNAMDALRRRLARVPDGTLSDLGRRAGVSIRQLRRLRNGNLSDVKLSTLARLAQALGITLAELIGISKRHARRAKGTGRKQGKPRTMRRQGEVGPVPAFNEDASEEYEDVRCPVM